MDKLLDYDYDVTGIDCFTDYYSRAIKEASLSKGLRKEFDEVII
jgi:hypothetical protein